MKASKNTWSFHSDNGGEEDDGEEARNNMNCNEYLTAIDTIGFSFVSRFHSLIHEFDLLNRWLDLFFFWCRHTIDDTMYKKIIIINYISFPSATTKRIGAKLYAFNVNFNIDTLLMCTKEMVAKKNGSAPNILSADHFFLFYEKKTVFFSSIHLCWNVNACQPAHSHRKRTKTLLNNQQLNWHKYVCEQFI